MKARILLAAGLSTLLAACSQSGTPSEQHARQTPPPPAGQGTPSGAATTEVPPPAPPVTFVPAMAGLPEAGMWKCDPIFADVNGDGFLDLAAIPRLGEGPRVWLGDGRGVWTASSEGLDPPPPSCGGGMAFGDANNDKNLDLIVADHCKGIFVYLGDGTGKWSMVLDGLDPQPPDPDRTKQKLYEGAEDLDVGDINRDGNLDIFVTASEEGGVHVYLGDGTGRNWQRSPTSLPIYGWANRVKLHDMNGDGVLDGIFSYGGGPRVFMNDGMGMMSPSSLGMPEPVIGGLYHGIDAGDVNEDGREDVIVANWVDGPEVYLALEDGTWQKMPDVFPEMRGGAIGVAVGDIDKDDHLDIVVSGRLENEGGLSRGVYFLRGDGEGHFTFVPNSGLPNDGLKKTMGVALADFNNDGVLDVAACSGLHIESAPGPTEPQIPQRILAWITKLPAAASTSVSGGDGATLTLQPDN